MNGFKRCIACGEPKPYSDFYQQRGMRDGFRNDCKACMCEQKRRRSRADPGAHISRVQQWQRENRERYLEAQRRRRAARGPAEKRRERDLHLSRHYGLTQDDFEFLVVVQRGRCAICGKEDGSRLHVDHDHSSGRVRGLLCGSCNRAMGLFHEDAARFEAAGAYLRRRQLPLGTGDRPRRVPRRIPKS